LAVHHAHHGVVIDLLEVIVDGLAVVDAEVPRLLPVRGVVFRPNAAASGYIRRNGLRDKELGYRSAGDLTASLRLPNETSCVVSASITAGNGRDRYLPLCTNVAVYGCAGWSGRFHYWGGPGTRACACLCASRRRGKRRYCRRTPSDGGSDVSARHRG
jgi:hypothetical protein